ncbi:MAG: hypothetical protein PHT59_05665, partial [Candidatus Omnitrophica bacterium]|nr:hypothetical protein [Candidatus Omnitrophota bacterium]
KSSMFVVTGIVVRQDGTVRQDASEFVYLKGRNLFDLDVRREARQIAGVYPSYQQVRLIKFYPNQLFIDFVKRKAVACIRGQRLLYVDENLVLFRLPEEAPQPAVPEITGITRGLSQAKAGTQCRLSQVTLAMQIISQLARAKALGERRLSRVDVLDPANASFFVFIGQPAAGGEVHGAPAARLLQVKIGNESVSERVKFLATLLAQVENNLYNIEYIDLRFQEPVIKFKERT